MGRGDGAWEHGNGTAANPSWHRKLLGVDCAGLERAGMDRAGLAWAGLGLAALGCEGVSWTGSHAAAGEFRMMLLAQK